jgi:hypothetical protein
MSFLLASTLDPGKDPLVIKTVYERVPGKGR